MKGQIKQMGEQTRQTDGQVGGWTKWIEGQTT